MLAGWNRRVEIQCRKYFGKLTCTLCVFQGNAEHCTNGKDAVNGRCVGQLVDKPVGPDTPDLPRSGAIVGMGLVPVGLESVPGPVLVHTVHCP